MKLNVPLLRKTKFYANMNREAEDCARRAAKERRFCRLFTTYSLLLIVWDLMPPLTLLGMSCAVLEVVLCIFVRWVSGKTIALHMANRCTILQLKDTAAKLADKAIEDCKRIDRELGDGWKHDDL